MEENKAYTGIDYFRLIASFLIIANHTSPLTTYSEEADFILTRIIARTAVPFFIMTSGFFLITRYNCNTHKLTAFLKRMGCLYAAAIILFLPLNVYNGYFSMEYLLPNMIKDMVFDGTLYHLWYFPAAMTGGAIAWFLVRKLGFRRAFIITIFLYLAGMFGDSYYGISSQLYPVRRFYEYLFDVMDYTRNGIFYTPVFFVLGGYLADQRHSRVPLKMCTAGFILSFFLMIGEGMILHHYDLQRHDSMYIMLVPCMYFLFTALTYFKGPRVLAVRTSALIIYIIHPMVIVIVRMIAKISGTQWLFIENSLVHYLAVSILSAAVSFSVAFIYHGIKTSAYHGIMYHGILCNGILCHGILCHMFRKHGKSRIDQQGTERAFIEINQENLKHNVTVLQEAMPPGCKIMAIVKADAYGHGAYEISSYINRMGVNAFGVATIEEGITLRGFGIQGDILILGYTNPLRAKDIRKYDLTQTVIDYPHAVSLNKQGIPVKVHVKIDTGMHRLGFDWLDIAEIEDVFRARYLKVCGIYTHLCAADSLAAEDEDFTRIQINRFYQTLDSLTEAAVKLPKIHIQSSYGLLNYPDLRCDYVRAGISLYGTLSSPDTHTRVKLDLRPVLSLKSQIVLIRKVKCGESIGYGRSFIMERDSLIAMLPLGYADGIPRNLSGRNMEVLIRGLLAPIAGRICMDQIAVDITDIPDAAVGDIVTLIGKEDENELTALEMAAHSDSITNEILSRMGKRLGITANR